MTDKLGLKICGIVFVAITLFTIITFKNSGSKQEQEQSSEQPSILNYADCDVTKIHSSEPFLVEITHNNMANRKIIETHFNSESRIMFYKDNWTTKFAPMSSDYWKVQISVEFKPKSDDNTIVITYSFKDKDHFELIEGLGNNWCRIFEINQIQKNERLI